MPRIERCLASLSILGFSLLAGCGVDTIAPPRSVQGSVLKGTVYGGQEPILGAHIYLLAAGSSGYGGASVSLLNTASTGYSDSIGAYVLTGAGGSFSISGDYSCTAGTQVYLYALGGDPGAGTNSAIGLMAAVGSCPASGTLSNTPKIAINEASTIAAAYAFAGYATDALHVSSSGTALAQTGIANAFGNATNLVDLASGSPLTTTPGGNGTVPQREIDTLADILASCVNSADNKGATSANCSALFAVATADGSASGTQPVETATAAINIAHHAGLNVGALYAMDGGSSSPFQPTLAAVPNDFTVRLAFSSGYQGTTESVTNTLAVDDVGNIWAVSPFCIATPGTTPPSTCVSPSTMWEFNSLGVPVSTSGYTAAPYTFTGAYSVAVDADSSNLWITTPASSYFNNSSSPNAAAVVKFNIASGAGTLQVNSTNIPDIAAPLDAVLDASGNVWVADNGGYLFQLDGNSGAVLNRVDGHGTYACGCGPVWFYWGVAMSGGAAGNLWATNDTVGRASVFTTAGALVSGSPYLFDKQWYSTSVAVDAKGSAWFAGDPGIASLAADGTPASGSPFVVTTFGYFGYTVGEGVAIDGDGNAWVTSGNNTVLEVNNSGASLTGTNGYLADTNAYPESIVIDGSGDVWYNANNALVYELVGAAAPVVTPIAYGVQTNQLGTRP